MDELRKLLTSVPDSYEDFVGAMLTYLKNDEENCEKMIAYIMDNPDKKTDDILEYMDELWGIR